MVQPSPGRLDRSVSKDTGAQIAPSLLPVEAEAAAPCQRIRPAPFSCSHVSDTSLPAPRDAQPGAVWGTLPPNPAAPEAETQHCSPYPGEGAGFFVFPLLIFLKQYVIALAADPPPFPLRLPHTGQRSAPFISLRFMRCKGLRLPCCPQPPPRD